MCRGDESASELEQAQGGSATDGGTAGLDAQLREDVPEVRLHRVARDEQRLADLSVRVAGPEHPQDLQLLAAQWLCRRFGRMHSVPADFRHARILTEGVDERLYLGREPALSLNAPEQRRNETRTHYLWRDLGESLEEVRERFRRMVEEGRANEDDDYIVFRWQW